ncbi:MAG: RNB domain-containing ribonuclease, partial [Spirochaetaceae bacterium]
LHLLHLVAQSLRRRREARGSVDLDLPSPHIAVDEDGVPISVRPSSRGSANRMVEECMLLANRLVAERLAADRSRPGVYRVHDAPRESDLDSLVETLNELGIPYQPDAEARTDDYRKILSLIQNFEFAELVESLAMKTLQKAVYATDNRGHFGLAMEAYTHFTSPIRRYPDLIVHRLLKNSLTGRSEGQSADYLERTCAHASERERLATDAEREYSRLKALEFLQKKKGREYSGMVTGVASIGLFVEIERYLIDGLVHISKLGRERFELDRPNHRLVGKSGTAFRIGDRVRVRVVAVDPAKRTADFELVTERRG